MKEVDFKEILLIDFVDGDQHINHILDLGFIFISIEDHEVYQVHERTIFCGLVVFQTFFDGVD